MLIVLIIPYYYCYDKDRYELTRKIFTHYRKIKEQLKEKNVDLKLMLVGSEKELSKSLSEPDDIYLEFEQGRTDDRQAIIAMLANKHNFCIEQGRKLSPDILLLAGSNDLITSPLFLKLINAYDEGCDFFCISGKINTVCCHIFDLKNKILYGWDGFYPSGSHHAWNSANCAGGLIGWTNRSLEKLQVIDTREADETRAYIQAKDLNFKIKHFIPEEDGFEFWNIKIGCEIHDLKGLINQLNANTKILPESIADEFMKYYISL